MDCEQIKIEPPIVVKEELELDENENPIDFNPDENEPISATFEKNEPGTEVDQKVLHTCSHCGDRKTSEEMAQTPETECELLKWSYILGETFYRDFKIKSMVCRSHFIDEFGDSRLVDVIHKNCIVETKLGDRMRCCYCGESRMMRSLTKVPKDELTLLEWVKILGKWFHKNFRRNNNGYICRSHFSTKWSGTRPIDILPVANLDENIFRKSTKKVSVLKQRISSSLIMSPKIEKQHDCIYCGEWKAPINLTKVPQNLKILKQWSDILGEEFHEKAVTKKQTFICRSHFDVKWQSYRPYGLLPCANYAELLAARVNLSIVVKEELEFDEYETEPPILVKEELRDEFSICEEVKLENEEKPQLIEDCPYKEENVSSNSETVKEDESEFDKQNFLTCSYCEDRKPVEQMVQTPETEDELLRWSNILGGKFYENFTIGTSVCRSHFIDEFGDSRLVDIVCGNVVVETKVGERSRCCYCGDLRMRKSVTSVPKAKTLFAKWVEILGKKFHEYFQINLNGYICRIHFDTVWEGRRPHDLLPVAYENEDFIENKSEENAELLYDYYHTGNIRLEKMTVCGYCREPTSIKDSTLVPQIPEKLKIWGYILGKEFYERALSKKTTFICRSHFDVKWENRRPKELLPYCKPIEVLSDGVQEELYSEVDSSTLSMTPYTYCDSDEENSKICCYCGVKLNPEKMAQVPRNQNELMKWSQILGRSFNKITSTGKMICRSHFDDEFGDSQLTDIVLMDRVIGTKIGEKVKCCYCGNMRMTRSVTIVSSDEPKFAEWVEILGEEFYEHFQKTKLGYICRSHFDVEWQGTRPENLLPVADVWEILNIMENRMISGEAGSNHSKRTRTNNMPICAYCEESTFYCNLTMVPSDPNTLKKWGDILGKRFYEKASTNPKTFICLSHFDVEWKNLRPPDLLPCVKSDHLIPNEVKEEVQEDSAKDEENCDEKPRNIIENDVKSENGDKDIDCKKSDILCETSKWIGRENFYDEPFDTKRIKLEVKEEL